MGFLLDFLYSHLLFTPPPPKKQYTGQTAIVTGSNTGIGFAAARLVVEQNAAKVILAVRSLDKGEAAKKSIEASTNRTGVIEVWPLDLGRYESIKQFASRAQSLQRLDVVIENAGILTFDFKRMEGEESLITTNVTSTMMLAVLLLPKMRETSVQFNVLPRLVIVGSWTHFLTKFPEKDEDNIFEALADEKKANMEDRYFVSKLMSLLCTRELASLMTKSENSKKGQVVLNTVNPGWCYSDVMRDVKYGYLGLLAFRTGRAIMARSAEYGARTYLGAVEAGEESHGQYMEDCRIGKVSSFVSSEEGAQVQKKVWTELAQKLEKIQPGILENI